MKKQTSFRMGVLVLALGAVGLFIHSRRPAGPPREGVLPAGEAARNTGEREYPRSGPGRQTPLSTEEIKRRAQEWNDRLLADRPELRITYRDLPDEQNGLLQLAKFLKDFDKEGLKLPKELEDAIKGRTPWDGPAAAAWLKENAALMAEIEKIGLLPGQSCAGVDQMELAGLGSTLMQFNSLLTAQARLAQESGDMEGAETALRASRGLANHLSGNEAPTMILMIQAEGMRRAGEAWKDRAMEEDGVTTAADLTRWREALPPIAPTDLATVLKGEWTIFGEGSLLPELLEGSGKTYAEELSRNPERSAEAIADFDAALVRRYQEMGPATLQKLLDDGGTSTWPEGEVPQDLPPEVRKALEQQALGYSAMISKMLTKRAAAALSDATAAVALGQPPPVEPLTGQPYRIDRETGTVTLPDVPFFSGLPAKKIPVLKQP